MAGDDAGGARGRPGHGGRMRVGGGRIAPVGQGGRAGTGDGPTRTAYPRRDPRPRTDAASGDAPGRPAMPPGRTPRPGAPNLP
ncbi:hypothetical protein C0Q59_04005 [Streptomyces albidoflavus]|nr:hypothetical protein C0Q59_04005 [Streptomyces albidoflavus]